MSLPDASLATFVSHLEDKQTTSGTLDQGEKPLEPENVALCRQQLQWYLHAEKPQDEHFTELLELKPASHWGAVIEALRERLPTRPASVKSALKLLQGWLTLFEVLCMLGSEWAPSVTHVQGLAQRTLFKLCRAETAASNLSIAGLLRAGANLLRSDSRGRVAAHHAAQQPNKELLGIIVRAAPATLILQDTEGFSPLEMLADQDMDKIVGPELQALVDAALHCMAALPQQTALVLQQSPSASEAWAFLSRSSHEQAMLLTAWREDIEEELTCVALQATEREAGAAARLQQCVQRLNLLRALTEDHEERHKELEGEELRRRLLRAEAALREREEASAQRVAALEQQVRHLQGLLMEGEEQLLALRRAAARGEVLNGSAELGVQLQEAGKPSSSQKIKAGTKIQKSPKNKMSQLACNESQTREEAVLQAICDDRMVGADPSKLPERFRSSVAEMRQSLTAAVDRLARDLYESEAHFLQELLQNADDNSYSQGVVPSVQFTLRAEKRATDSSDFKAYFYAANNEVGLREQDVRALCDISRSSKSLAKGMTTGYKGVGWKSVFCVSDTPHVLSHGWRFKFSAKGLGMLTPESLSDAEYDALPQEVRDAHQAGNTVFFLPLTSATSIASIEAEMAVMESDVAQLLFLRRLREIHLKGHCKEEACVSVLGAQEDVREATLSVRKSVDTESAITAEERVETNFEVCKQGDVMVAVPLAEEPPSQRIFAFLPVRCVGFRFAVHAPFHLTASRTDLHRSLDNTQLRNAIAPAFLSACQANKEVAVNALKFLGTEPTDVFWLPVRTAILSGLQGVECVLTESGCTAPENCVLRGDDPAMQWLPESLLEDACGLSFATAANPREVLRDLGIRKCDFDELVACISHEEGKWLKSMWRSPNRDAVFSDIYASLAQALLAEPDRVQELQNLKIFPVATEGLGGTGNLSASLLNEVVLSASAGLYSALCQAVPREWQLHLLQCLSFDLQITPHGRKLLSLVGVERVTESELERIALRQVLLPASSEVPSQQDGRRSCSIASDIKVIWSALAVLRRCFQLGRTPPQPWAEVRNAITLPSASGQFLAPCLLRPWSFIGVQVKIPKGLRQSIYEFAGISVLTSEILCLESVAIPSMEPPSGESRAGWHFGWEVFLCVLGCTPVDPTGQYGECCLEATLQVGDVLVSGEFWQNVSKSPPAKAYLDSVLGRGPQHRLHWLRRLPVTLPNGNMVSVEDFFAHEVFHRLAGSHLPYVFDITGDPEIHSLLCRLGIGVEMNRSTLLKCLRFLRRQNVQDIGLAADIYLRLGQMDQQGLGQEDLLLVPGHGYMRQEDCCWRPFQLPLLQRCNRLQVLVEHYSRFGSSVCDTLRQWVVPTADSHAQALCEAMLEVLTCAKASNSCPHFGTAAIPPEEAMANLLPVAQHVVGCLANLCARDAEIIGNRATESSSIASSFYHRQRTIVVPDRPPMIGGQRGAGPRLLSVSEAYWSVEPELQQDPCAGWALEAHYSNLTTASTELVRDFFVTVLGVKPVFHALKGSALLAHQGYPRSALPTASDANESSRCSEGLQHARVLVARPPTETQQAPPLDHSRGAAQLAIGRAQFSAFPDRPRQGRAQQQTGWNSPGSNMTSGTAQSSSSGPQHTQNCSMQGHSTGPPTAWRLAGNIEEFKVFLREGAPTPSEGHPVPDVAQLRRICAACGFSPGQVGLAYDPSGQCVCQDYLFLDISRAPFAASLPTPAAALVFWVSELAYAVAHCGTDCTDWHRFAQLQSEIQAFLLPNAYTAEWQYWNQQNS